MANITTKGNRKSILATRQFQPMFPIPIPSSLFPQSLNRHPSGHQQYINPPEPTHRLSPSHPHSHRASKHTNTRKIVERRELFPVASSREFPTTASLQRLTDWRNKKSYLPRAAAAAAAAFVQIVERSRYRAAYILKSAAALPRALALLGNRAGGKKEPISKNRTRKDRG